MAKEKKRRARIVKQKEKKRARSGRKKKAKLVKFWTEACNGPTQASVCKGGTYPTGTNKFVISNGQGLGCPLVVTPFYTTHCACPQHRHSREASIATAVVPRAPRARDPVSVICNTILHAAHSSYRQGISSGSTATTTRNLTQISRATTGVQKREAVACIPVAENADLSACLWRLLFGISPSSRRKKGVNTPRNYVPLTA